MIIFKYQKTAFIILSIILCCHGDSKAGFSSIQYGYRLLYRMIESYVNYSLLDCVEECLRTKRCRSVNYYRGANFCEINFRRNVDQQELYRQASGWLYTDIENWDEVLAESCAGSPCQINEKCLPKPLGQFECVLSDCGFPVNMVDNTTVNVQEWDGIGIRKRMHLKCLDSFEQRGSGMIVCHKNGTWITDLVCQVRTDCKDLRDKGHTNSGVYQIYPFGTDSDSVPVYCNMEIMGGGWTLTKGNNSSLYVSITLLNSTKLYELYEKFAISDETEKYKLFLEGPPRGTLGDGMLNTGAPTRDLSGMYFSTPDRDNDLSSPGSCAAYYKGGWWFHSCHRAFLNGLWFSSREWIWYPSVKYGTSVRETLMMIRRH